MKLFDLKSSPGPHRSHARIGQSLRGILKPGPNNEAFGPGKWLFLLLPFLVQACSTWSPPENSSKGSSFNRWEEVHGQSSPATTWKTPQTPLEVPPLYDLIAHPHVGSFVLSPAWIGREEISLRSGLLLTSQKWVQGDLERPLKFDCFTFFQDEAFGGPGRITICERDDDNTLRNVYHHRDRLPDNERITECKVRKEINALLHTGEGLEVWGEPQELHTSESWHFFTLKDPSTIATLSVFCVFTHRPNMEDWAVEGLRITRGTATR